MIRKAFVTELNPDNEEEYGARHSLIWRELIDIFATRGIQNYD